MQNNHLIKDDKKKAGKSATIPCVIQESIAASSPRILLSDYGSSLSLPAYVTVTYAKNTIGINNAKFNEKN